jgi:hypothetical protein
MKPGAYGGVRLLCLRGEIVSSKVVDGAITALAWFIALTATVVAVQLVSQGHYVPAIGCTMSACCAALTAFWHPGVRKGER